MQDNLRQLYKDSHLKSVCILFLQINGFDGDLLMEGTDLINIFIRNMNYCYDI